MCGIAGFFGFRNDALIKDFSAWLEHRGPDGEGLYLHDNVTLLSRRLAIIDRAGGDQPIYNEDKTLAIVYNGEIYNFQELKAELEAAGHTFATHCDTEVIVHGYEEWGDSCFDKLNGMFGVALYDTKNDELILARDHFGIKPLYFSFVDTKNAIYAPASAAHADGGQTSTLALKLAEGSTPRTEFSGQLIFASEIKPLIWSGLVAKKPNDRILYRYLQYRIHEDSQETFFEGVHKLMPGEVMHVSQTGISRKYFSTLETEEIAVTHKEAGQTEIAAFKDKLIESISRRLISEVPVGTCLSGGLDSSTVVATVNQLLAEKSAAAVAVGSIQNTFSAVFPGSTNDEERYVDTLVKPMEQITVHKIYPKAEEFFKELEDFVRTQEEPTISTGPYAQYKVMQEAHKFVTVVLDGQGADEMMAGYLPYYFVYLRQLRREKKYRELAAEIAASRDVLLKYGQMRLTSKLGIKKAVSVNNLLNPTFANKHRAERFPVTQDNLKKRLREDIFHNSLPSLLRYEDKNSMRFSIEGRVPFLDFNLLRYLESLPDEAIIKNGWNKYVLREATRTLLPDIINRRRNKIGFTTPEHEWFLRMKNAIYALFMSESFANRPYFKQAEVVKAFQEFIEGKNDDTMVFWRMLNVEMWLRIFFDQAPAQLTEPAREKGFFEPNKDKQIAIATTLGEFERYPIKTRLFQKDDDVSAAVQAHLDEFFNKAGFDKTAPQLTGRKWFIILSEKVVAIAQGRSYFIWDIKPTWAAKTLAKFVRRTPFGIGLGSPWTMQLAIDEVGLPRIILAAAASVATKPLGMRGVFYHIAGRQVGEIDGPTEYSLYPSNVSAKLGPKEPEKVAQQIREYLQTRLPASATANFQGVAIIDANDLGRRVLGNASAYKNKEIEDIFKDNPLGQGSEQTPLAVVVEAQNLKSNLQSPVSQAHN